MGSPKRFSVASAVKKSFKGGREEGEKERKEGRK
jgi:hypothetical protein